MSFLDTRSEQDFLIYANSVIKSRAIPSAEDNLKPIHRKILWTLFEDKVYSDKPTKKCATEVGRALAYSPHGDASVYGALVRLGQWWKLRYPLIFIQGNAGNLLGDSAAASRYTECKLSPIGMMMLEDINKNCVDFKPNYDNTQEEPVTLPSKFPFLLCGNNSGIAVGMSSDLVSHNFTEVCEAIKYYIHNRDCSIADLMQYIKGPDFPTGGLIINGEELLEIYSRGQGSIKMVSHYDITKQGSKTLITFHDLPYGVEIDDGIKKPLKKLVLDEGYEVFEDINVSKAGPRNFDITVTLGKNADVAKCLEILFSKTKLGSTIKVNQTLIVDGEPKQLNLKQLIEYWVNYRSKCIRRIADTDYQKTNHKLTVTIGLQKCMSDIDKVINIVRQADDRNAAKRALILAFELNEEQADAVLDMKLSRLSRLDLQELNSTEKELEKTLASLKVLLDSEEARDEVIINDLAEIKKVLGKDERLTEIHYARPAVTSNEPLVKTEYYITDNSVIEKNDLNSTNIPTDLRQVVFAYGREDIMVYGGDEMAPANKPLDSAIQGAFIKNNKKTKLVAVTKNGNIKISNISEYKLNKTEKVLKVKEDDSLVMVGLADDNDYVLIFNGTHIIKLPVSELTVAGKITLGVKTGFTEVISAMIVNDSDIIIMTTAEGKGHYTAVKDFSLDSRGNKGQAVTEGTNDIHVFEDSRTNIYLIPKLGKPVAVDRSKIAIKGRTAQGATLSTKVLRRIV